MSRIVTPKYRVELVAQGASLTPMSWSGRATPERLGKYIRDLNQSFEMGGVNYVSGRPVVKVVRAQLVEQRSGRVVAIWERDRGAC